MAHPDAPAPLVALGKPLALLAYLGLAPNRTASRERLADLLWGDHERADARHALRRALSFLRSRVGDWVLVADDHTCTASPELGVDVVDFVARVERGDYAAALELYRGDFLAGFASPGGREFEAWADIERAHLRSRAVRAADAWCRDALDRARFADARRAARRVGEIDRESELGWRLRLEVLVAAGDRLGAAAEAAHFQAWLAAEARDPEPASRAMLRAATQPRAADVPAGPATHAPAPDLVGREPEYAAILDAWQRARRGTVQVLVVTGAAGLGKSRLLDAVADRIRSLRQRVVVVRAHSGERTIPNAFAGAVAYEVGRLSGAASTSSAVLPHLVALDPRLAGLFPGTNTRGATTPEVAPRATALRELFAAVCDEAPLALLLDDAHWFDDASHQLLAGALARFHDGALLVVVATRDTAPGAVIDERALPLPLAALSEHDVVALVASLGTLPADETWPAAMISRVTAVSRGIPLLVLGALQQLVERGCLALRDGVWQVHDEAGLRERLHQLDPLGGRLRDLPPPAFRALLAIATAGVPLPADAAHAIARRVAPELSNALGDLERLGFLRSEGGCLMPAHDAVAETALEVASECVRRAAERELGLALAGSTESQWVERGVRHLAAVGDIDALREPFARLARPRLRGWRDSPRRIAAAVSGRPADDPVVAAMAGALPLAVRFRRFRGVTAATAAVVGLASVGLAAEWFGARGPDAALEILVPVSGDFVRSARVLLGRDGWIGGAPLSARLGGSRRDTIPRPQRGAHVAPGGTMWAVTVTSADSGGVDMALVDRSGSVRRLTRSGADETPGAWSPDGRALVIETSAFSPSRHKTIAILDVATGGVRPVGRTDRLSREPVWSPDGTRIAFSATWSDGLTTELCVVAVAFSTESCGRWSARDVQPLGWLTNATVLALAPRRGSLLRFDVASARFEATGVDGVRAADLSPDGRWVMFRRGGARQGDVYVAPSEDLRLARRVEASVGLSDAAVAWVGRFAPRDYLDRLSIETARASIPLGAPFRLLPNGNSASGAVVTVSDAVWTSLTPRIATVDSAGVLTPIREGTAVVELSAGGWRRATRSFPVVREPSRLVLAESWNDPFAARWVPFGDPLPRVVYDRRLGRAFLNDGDGRFFSGAYLSPPIDGRAGVALDATVSVPITRPQWQYLDVALGILWNPPDLRHLWDHVTGYLPRSRMHRENTCGFAYPQGEGPDAVSQVGGFGELTRQPGATLPQLALGVPTRVRVQIFPDGRCGIAIEGERPSVSDAPLARFDSLVVIIQGHSVGTRVLVGPLTIRTGVPSGVDWTARTERWMPGRPN